ncbi:tumor necrosis factor receptor superfamily member 9-like [Syngnathus acus]|uniref:tumor necrosis factor receptor superfamily member 9-like n=1 Tax=Syngnathus acus TaxID=161584 RepID=UPI001885EEEC|nr:tumor necrosis factor receptor superfamily member 9-like [Syngnathus acus]
MAALVSLDLPLLLLLLLLGCSHGGLQEQIRSGCKKWTRMSSEVCCDECHPGNRLVSYCGADPSNLCTPCESGTYSQKAKDYKCSRCTQCEGAQVLLKACSATGDTLCGCKEGLLCGDQGCSFCRKKCGKGEEPADKRSCRPCANGTFNDQIHQKCKSWSTRCPGPDQMAAGGDAFSDIKCVNVSRSNRKEGTGAEQAWLVVTGVCLMASSVTLFVVMAVYRCERNKKTTAAVQTARVPVESTEEPNTLIAVECSFHEAQEEQGSSSQSSASEDSRQQLVV